MAILGQFWPILTQNDPKLTFKIHFWVFLFEIHTQWLKLCGKVVLFCYLDLLILIRPFGPIWELLGPKSPKDLGKHTLKIFSWTPLTYRYWKQALLQNISLTKDVRYVSGVKKIWGYVSQDPWEILALEVPKLAQMA